MHLPEHPLFEELKKLALPQGEYAIFGSGPLWVRGIREGNDLDIIALGTAWEWAVAHGRVGIKEESQLEYVQFADGKIEVYCDWYPGEWHVDELIETAETVDGVPFVQLRQVIDWKKKMGREKDQKDLILIEAYLAKQNETL